MLVFSRNVGKTLERQLVCSYSTSTEAKTEIKGEILFYGK